MWEWNGIMYGKHVWKSMYGKSVEVGVVGMKGAGRR